MKMIPYSHQTFEADDQRALSEVLNQLWVTRGPKVSAFEQALGEYCQIPYVVIFNSGTAAISAAYFAAQISSKDLIVTSPNTFVGTVSYALHHTKNLRFVDLDLKTGCGIFDPDHLDAHYEKICIVPVLFSGIPQEIQKTSKNQILIEDACEAFGSTYLSGQKVGSCPHSDMTVFSFHPAKTICTGEGGAVTTKSKELYERLLLFRNNGIVKKESEDPWFYEVIELSNNYNVTEFQAALGLSQLKKADHFIQARRDLVTRYRRHLEGIKDLELFDPCYDHHSAHNLFPILIDFKKLRCSRKEVMTFLKGKGISTQVHFIPLYRHPYFQKNFSFKSSDFPNMETYYERELSLPLYAHLKITEVDEICSTLKECLSFLSRPF